MNNFKKFLTENLKGRNNTLLSQLHENSILNMVYLDEYFNIVKTVLKDKQVAVDIELLSKLYSVQFLIMKYLIAHHDKNDGYSISNLSDEIYLDIIDEFDCLFDHTKLVN